jgi:hypothetical protein
VDDAIPAIVDQQTWDTFHLKQGKRFILRGEVGGITFVAMGKVSHIPTVNDNAQNFGGGGDLSSGLLVDYQSYAVVYDYLIKRMQNPSFNFGRGGPSVVTTNYVWLSTNSDSKTLAAVRRALNSGPLQLSTLYDRRATMQKLSSDPLSLNLVGILILGALVPLLLAWIGCLIASWFSARQRHTIYGVLRALGCAPQEMARVLVWEQAIVYGTAIVLGVLFGLLTSLMALPSLVLTSTIPGIYTPSPSGGFIPSQDVTNMPDLFSLQNTPPAHAVISPMLGLAVGLLVLLGILAVILMKSSISRIALARALRLNED